jgi:hypothetical protein
MENIMTGNLINNLAGKDQTVQEQFKKLASDWRKATSFHSSLMKKVSHPTYLKIIDIGMPVVPFLLKELEQNPDHWFVALQKITRADPIPEEAYGKMEKMSEAWLSWGRENNVRW